MLQLLFNKEGKSIIASRLAEKDMDLFGKDVHIRVDPVTQETVYYQEDLSDVNNN